MSIQNINVSTPNDGLGDLLRDAFIKVNENFLELQGMITDGVTQGEFDMAVSGLTLSINDIYDILDTKSNVGHTHIIADIFGLQTALNGLVSTSDFTSAISNINFLISQLNNDITNIEGDIVDLQNTDVSLQNQINTLNEKYVPLTGTTSGFPISGELRFGNEENFLSATNGVASSDLLISDYGNIAMESTDGLDNNKIVSTPLFTRIENSNPSSRGMVGAQDFTANITDLDYTQKKYVDDRISGCTLQFVTSLGNTTTNDVIFQGNTYQNNGIVNSGYLNFLKNGINGEFTYLDGLFKGDLSDESAILNMGYKENKWFRYDDTILSSGNGIQLLPGGFTNLSSFTLDTITNVNIEPEQLNINSTNSITNGFSSFTNNSQGITFQNSIDGTNYALARLDDQDGFSLSTDSGARIASLRADGLTANRQFNYPNYSGTLTTQEHVDGKLLLKQNLPTGFITGMTLNINQFDNTKFDIAPGAYCITDFSNIQNIQTTIIQLPNGITGITPSYLTVSGVNASYIAIDVNQNIVQSSSPFENNQRRSLAILGAVIHSNNININTTNEIKAPIIGPTNQLHDFIKAVGALNLNGNVFSPNGANLSLNKSAGQIWGLGINGGDYTDPHRLTLSGMTGLTFAYRLSNGTQFANTTLLDPTQYESAPGILTALSNNNRWSVQHVNIFQSGLVRIQYGQHEYTSFDQAIAKMFVEDFVTEQNIAENSIFRAYVVMKKTTTNLAADIASGDAAIVSVDKFGNAVGGPGNALTSAAVIAALGYTPENVANKATSFVTLNNTLYPTTQAVSNSFIPKDDGATYDTNFIKTMTQAEYNAISGSTSSSTLYFII